MNRPRRLVLTVVVLMTCVALTGCGGDDDVPGLLQKDDLPSVSKVANGRSVPAVAVCGETNEAQFKLTIGNKPEGVAQEYILDSGDQVYSSVLGRSSSYGTLQAGMDGVVAAITECAAETFGGEVFKPMTGLDAGVVGYTAVSPDADPPRFGARVFAIQGDRIIVVGTQHRGEGGPEVDVVELLPKALERAKDAPKD